MVFVQNLPRLVQIELFLARLFPRQFEDVFEIGADNVIIRCRLRKLFHPLQLAFGFFANLFGQVGGFQTFAKLSGLGLFAALVLAKLLLDRLHLLPQDVIALRFVHLGLRFGGDLRPDLHYLDLASEGSVRQRQKPIDRIRFEHLLLGFDAEIENGRKKIGKLYRVLLRHHGHPDLGRNVRQQSEGLLDHSLDVAFQGLDLFFVGRGQIGQYLASWP